MVKIANIGYGKFIHSEQEYLPIEYGQEFSNYVVKPNTLLMTLTRPITNNTMKVCIYPDNTKEGLLNQRVAMIPILGLRWIIDICSTSCSHLFFEIK